MIKKTIIKNIDLKSKRNLSIQFSLDGFSFCIINDQKEIVEFSAFSFDEEVNSPELILIKLQEIFKSEKSLQSDFETVNVIHQNNLNTLVPNEFFEENSLKDYLKFTIKTIATDLIVFDDLNCIDSKNVYVPYVNINNFLFQNFGEFEFKHHSSILLDKLFNKSNSPLEFYVNVNKSTYDIVILKDTKLEFYNSFDYQTKEDFIYYILFTLEQLELSADTTTVSLLGEIDTESNLYKILYTYIRNIEFLEIENEFMNSQTEILKHSNYILLG